SCMTLESMHALTGDHTPEPRRLIVTSGDQGLAVGRERHRLDNGPMPFENSDLPLGGDIPQSYGVVTAARDEGLIVRGECQAVDRTAVSLQDTRHAARADVPELDALLPGADRDRSPAVGDPHPPPALNRHGSEFPAGCQVP